MPAEPKNLKQIDADSILHPSTNANEFAKTGSRIIQSGKGIYLEDTDGNRLIDAVAGLWCVNVGYGRPEIANAMHKAATDLSYYHTFTGMSNVPQIELAERLLAIAPNNMSKVFFASGGSDGNDSLMKIVWYYHNLIGKPEKRKIISRWQSYHGTSIATASLTGLPSFHKDFNLPIEGVLHTESPDYFRHGKPGESELDFSKRRAAELEALILQHGPETVGAFIAEPVMGAGGVITPPEGYFAEIQKVTKKYDILFIADEVVCGYGRLGTWFGSEVYDIKPDMITTAKALTSGYFPFSASFITEQIWDVIKQGSAKYGSFAHGYTYAGHPIGAAVAMANLDIIENDGLIAQSADVGQYFHTQLNQRFANDPFVAQVRGQGMLAAVQLMQDKDSKTFFDPAIKIAPSVTVKCYQNGLIARPLPSVDSVAFSPPLVTSKAQVDDIVNIFEASVRDVMQQHGL
ncbi:aminotransferase [Arenicella xantha]|uniref:L-2,4-diaminobutyrate transaminase n=1 Tax=Arenicella xantha TaxID=644221 RepID=A0A395JP81_9GAMM|nr:aminotransferase [Arenicella xantha]RBP51597.1 L-2,4-diaminobutyrate transaminase [Arenicella xantha]